MGTESTRESGDGPGKVSSCSGFLAKNAFA